MHFGRIRSLEQTQRRSDGINTASPLKMQPTLHQRISSGNDRLKWAKVTPLSHLYGETSKSRFQMGSTNSHLVIAGSWLPHQPLLRRLTEFTNLHTTKSIINTASSDSSSGSRMAGMALILTTDFPVRITAEDFVPGPPRGPTPKLGGCLFSKKLMQNLIKIMIGS